MVCSSCTPKAMYPTRRGTFPNLASAQNTTVDSDNIVRTKRMIPTRAAKDSMASVYLGCLLVLTNLLPDLEEQSVPL